MIKTQGNSRMANISRRSGCDSRFNDAPNSPRQVDLKEEFQGELPSVVTKVKEWLTRDNIDEELDLGKH